jgi:arginine decarboxylase
MILTTTDTPAGNALRRIIEGLKEYGIRIADIGSSDDTQSALANLPEADCIFINWNLGGDTPERHKATAGIIQEIRKRNDDIPIFLMGEPGKNRQRP